MKIQILCAAMLCGWAANANATALDIDLGAANPFVVLAGSTVTSTGLTSLHGDLGVSPGTAVVGFPPGVVSGTIHTGDATALHAQADLTTAFNFAAAQSCGTVLSGQDLGGLTLTPGVYCFGAAAQLSGALTLDALGDPNAVFLFQVGSALGATGGSSVTLTGGGRGDRVFWQVGSSATLGAGVAFAGSILADQSIDLGAGDSFVCGRALARHGAVTMDTDSLSIGGAGCLAAPGGGVPEPSTWAFMLTGLGLVGAAMRQARAPIVA